MSVCLSVWCVCVVCLFYEFYDIHPLISINNVMPLITFFELLTTNTPATGTGTDIALYATYATLSPHHSH